MKKCVGIGWMIVGLMLVATAVTTLHRSSEERQLAASIRERMQAPDEKAMELCRSRSHLMVECMADQLTDMAWVVSFMDSNGHSVESRRTLLGCMKTDPVDWIKVRSCIQHEGV